MVVNVRAREPGSYKLYGSTRSIINPRCNRINYSVHPGTVFARVLVLEKRPLPNENIFLALYKLLKRRGLL